MAVNDSLGWQVNWAHGSFSVIARGGMLADTRIFLPSGRNVQPFYEAPWIGEPGPIEPPLLAGMRNEFSCVPFGGLYDTVKLTAGWRTALHASDDNNDITDSDLLLHGFGGEADWQLVEHTEHGVTIAIDYPETSPISRVTRMVSCVPDAPAIVFSLKVEARRATRRPMGVHPNIALPKIVGAVTLKPRHFYFGMVHPAGPEAGVSRGLPGEVFTDLAEVPLLAGGVGAFNKLPFSHNTEEIVQLCGADGHVEIENSEQASRYTLSWDAAVLPSLLLWISNRGRPYAPWNSRNLCVGVEPMIGAFDLGTAAALVDNPINAQGVATAIAIAPDNPVTLTYRFEATDMT